MQVMAAFYVQVKACSSIWKKYEFMVQKLNFLKYTKESRRAFIYFEKIHICLGHLCSYHFLYLKVWQIEIDGLLAIYFMQVCVNVQN
jgi:hypothetical protein